MQRVGKSKIGRLRAKNIDYPQLRLPQQYSSTIGDVAGVFETVHEGKQASLIVTEHTAPTEDMVLKPSEESMGFPSILSIGLTVHRPFLLCEKLKKDRYVGVV